MTTTVLGIIYYKIIRTQGHYYMVKKLKKPCTHWHNRLCSYDSDWARTNDLMPVNSRHAVLSVTDKWLKYCHINIIVGCGIDKHIKNNSCCPSCATNWATKNITS